MDIEDDEERYEIVNWTFRWAPGADKWKESAAVDPFWIKGRLKRAMAVEDPIRRYNLLGWVSESGHMRKADPEDKKAVKKAVRELKKDKRVRDEIAAAKLIKKGRDLELKISGNLARKKTAIAYYKKVLEDYEETGAAEMAKVYLSWLEKKNQP